MESRWRALEGDYGGGTDGRASSTERRGEQREMERDSELLKVSRRTASLRPRVSFVEIPTIRIADFFVDTEWSDIVHPSSAQHPESSRTVRRSDLLGGRNTIRDQEE